MNNKQSKRLEAFSDLCDNCGGLGEITRYFGGGKYESTIDCVPCRGRGVIGNCTACGGTGVVPDRPGTECPHCLGVGARGDCPDCGGIGLVKKDESECPNCSGFGFIDGKS